MNLINFQESDYEHIEDLSSKGYVAKAIALTLGVDVAFFTLLCTDVTHPIGRAYQLGRLEIERKKNKKLLKKIKGGSETAIQIHDNKAEEQHFQDVKNDIFSAITDE